MKYQTTKKQCQKNINKFNNVCDRCGRKLKPLRTVDNAGNPTYWIGCYHGSKGENAWGHFTEGVSKEIYDLATKLVLDDGLTFRISRAEEITDFEYYYQKAIYNACDILRQVEYIKKHKPRYTKKQLLSITTPPKTK